MPPGGVAGAPSGAAHGRLYWLPVTVLDRFLARQRAPALVLFVLAACVRAVGVTKLFHATAYFADERMYLRLADVVAGGRWLGEGVELPPGLIYAMAFGRLLGLDAMGLRYFFCLFGAGMVAVLFLTARRIFGGRTALLAALGATVYPYLIYLCGTFYSQTIFQLTLALVFYGLLRFIQDDAWRWLVVAGVALGLSGLTVVPILSAAPLLVLWLLTSARGPIRRRLGAGVLLGALTLLTILPWTARNYAVAHRFVFISDFGGPSFYWVNNAMANPYDRDATAWLERNMWRLEREQARQGMTREELNRHLAFRAERFWKLHPERAWRNYAIRLSMFFDLAPRSFTQNEHTRSRTTDLVAIVSSLPVLLLAPLGLLFGRRRWRLWWPLAAVPIVQAVSYAMFHVTVRYRLPFEPWFLLFAVVAVVGVGWPEWLREPGAPANRKLAPDASRDATAGAS